jgi:hypothetical protein
MSIDDHGQGASARRHAGILELAPLVLADAADLLAGAPPSPQRQQYQQAQS